MLLCGQVYELGRKCLMLDHLENVERGKMDRPVASNDNRMAWTSIFFIDVQRCYGLGAIQ